MALAEEPPVRVRTGSVNVTIDTEEAGIEWTTPNAWFWVRIGPPSPHLGEFWIFVNDVPVAVPNPPDGVVRVETTDGVLFFRYRNGRTGVTSDVQFRRSPRDRKTIEHGVAAAAGQQPATHVTEVAVAVSDDSLEFRPLAVVEGRYVDPGAAAQA